MDLYFLDLVDAQTGIQAHTDGGLEIVQIALCGQGGDRNDGLLLGRQGLNADLGLLLRVTTAAVVRIANLLLPDHILAIPAAGDHQMGHRCLWCRSVPVIEVGRTPDRLALFEFDDFAVSRAGECYA
jgi:hypothetical protein